MYEECEVGMTGRSVVLFKCKCGHSQLQELPECFDKVYRQCISCSRKIKIKPFNGSYKIYVES